MSLQDTILSSLNRRYATKAFDPSKKVSEKDIHVLEEVLRLTPSSFGLQPRGFVIVTDDTIKRVLLAETMQQQQVVSCSHLVVLCARTDIDDAFVDRFVAHIIFHGGDQERAERYRTMLKNKIYSMKNNNTLDSYIDNQVYIALGNLLTSCALLHIDACPMGGFHPAGYDTILNLKEKNLRSVVICPIGYRDTSDMMATKPKIRFSPDQLIYII